MNKDMMKGMVVLALIIPLCVIFIRILTGRETVADYANEHPEQQMSAVVTPEVTVQLTPEITQQIEEYTNK